MSTLRILPACVALALTVAAGCGSGAPKADPVVGKVVYKGTTELVTRLAGGYVCLESVADPTNKPVGQIDDDGAFFLGTVVGGKNLGGILPGEYRVRVVPPENSETGQLARGVIDPRLAKFDTSGLRLTIAAGQKDVTIEVDRPRR